MNNKEDVELLEKVRAGLTEQCDMLPEKTQKRLYLIRNNVINSAVPQQRFFKQTILGMPLAPFSAAMTVGVLGFALLAVPGSPLQNHVVNDETFANEVDDVVNDVDVLMSNEDMEFLENLEIYEWLDAEYG